jgi:hypothetical protein
MAPPWNGQGGLPISTLLDGAWRPKKSLHLEHANA